MVIIASVTAYEDPKPIDRNWSGRESVENFSPQLIVRTKQIPGGATARLLCCIVLIILPTQASPGQDTLTDRTTGKKFPRTISFTHQGTEHTLSLTGLAVRKKFFFSIYCIAHYMQDAPRGSTRAVLQAILQDGAAKQVTMDFVRDIRAEKIQTALTEGFRNNTSASEFEDMQPLVRRFARSIYKDVKKGDKFIVRWLPGGTTVSIFEDQEVSTIKSMPFTKALWSSWFGERSVVDRKSLVQLLVINP